jgi:hypothetical protein
MLPINGIPHTGRLSMLWTAATLNPSLALWPDTNWETREASLRTSAALPFLGGSFGASREQNFRVAQELAMQHAASASERRTAVSMG